MQERKPKQFRARHKAGEGRKPEVEPQGGKNDEDEIKKRPHKGQGLRRSDVGYVGRDDETRQAGFDERADVAPQLRNITAQLYLSGDEKENRCFKQHESEDAGRHEQDGEASVPNST